MANQDPNLYKADPLPFRTFNSIINQKRIILPEPPARLQKTVKPVAIVKPVETVRLGVTARPAVKIMKTIEELKMEKYDKIMKSKKALVGININKVVKMLKIKPQQYKMENQTPSRKSYMSVKRVEKERSEKLAAAVMSVKSLTPVISLQSTSSKTTKKGPNRLMNTTKKNNSDMFVFACTPQPVDCCAPLETVCGNDPNDVPPEKPKPPQRHYENVMWDRHVNRGSYKNDPMFTCGKDGKPIQKARLPYKRTEFPKLQKICKADELKGVIKVGPDEKVKEKVVIHTPRVVSGRVHCYAQTLPNRVTLTDDTFIRHADVQTDPVFDETMVAPVRNYITDTTVWADKCTETCHDLVDLTDCEAQVEQIIITLVRAVMNTAIQEHLDECELASLRAQEAHYDNVMYENMKYLSKLKKRENKSVNEKVRQAVQNHGLESQLMLMWRATPSTEVGINLVKIYGGELPVLIHNNFTKTLNPHIHKIVKKAGVCRALLDDILLDMTYYREAEYARGEIINYLGYDPWTQAPTVVIEDDDGSFNEYIINPEWNHEDEEEEESSESDSTTDEDFTTSSTTGSTN